MQVVGDCPPDRRDPKENGEMIDLNALLRTVAEKGGSDLHLRVGSSPLIRIDGQLQSLGGSRLTPEDTGTLVRSIMPPQRWTRLEQHKEADFAHSVQGIGRFRANAYFQRGSISVVFRRVRVGSPSYEQLGLPPAVAQLAEAPRGLVLVTGPTGSGKTTTLAAMIDQINSARPVHILTIEDPIEVLHPAKRASVSQRELGLDTDTYLEAMRSAMRQDPDVILIGEMRDHETVAAALAAAETGHLVLSTLHTTDAVETVNRVVDFFPATHQHQVRVSLASVLRGVICQRLVQRVGGGRIPVVEILVNNGRIADRIRDAHTTAEIPEIVADSAFYGMQTFDQSLLALVRQGLVTVQEAMSIATNAHDLGLMLEQAGVRASA
jgi:twitching motility protein PilT